jgi:threonine dehydratase
LGQWVRLEADPSVVGVQTTRFPLMFNVLKGRSEPMGSPKIAEGIAVQAAGAITGELVARFVDDIVLVDEGDVERAIVMLLEIEKTLVEGGAPRWQRYCATEPPSRGVRSASS